MRIKFVLLSNGKIRYFRTGCNQNNTKIESNNILRTMKLHFCQAFIETYSVVIRFSSDKEDNCEKKEKTASFRVVSVCHFNFYRFLPSKSISMNNGRYFLRLYKHRFCLFISVFLFLLPTTTNSSLNYIISFSFWSIFSSFSCIWVVLYSFLV